jgi:dolichyl-phosphate-mannose-protein mannosyltransferase
MPDFDGTNPRNSTRNHLASARALFSGRDGPLFALCAWLVVCGTWLRTQNLGFPEGLSWDEHHFVLNARNYLAHQHDWNDHPPLGKLLIAIGMLAFGDNAVGWRIVPLICGVANIAFAWSLAVTLYRDRCAGWLAAAFVAGDGFLIAYSRTALLDGILTSFLLATACILSRRPTVTRAAVAAVVIGCAANIKLSGFPLLVPAGIICLLGRRPLRCTATLVLAPAAYCACFALGLYLAREPYSLASVWQGTKAIVAHHAALTEFKHPMTSHWYTWFEPKRPITLRYDTVGLDEVRIMTTLGNLVLWWTAAAALIMTTFTSVGAMWRVVVARSMRVHLGRRARANAFLYAFAITMMLPWIIGKRDSYVYHYLPTYAFLLIIVAGEISRIYRQQRTQAMAFVSAVALVSAFFAPVWGQLPMTARDVQYRLFLPNWR